MENVLEALFWLLMLWPVALIVAYCAFSSYLDRKHGPY